MTFTGKFVHMAQHFIMLWLSQFELRADREGGWFDHSVSKLRIFLSPEVSKNVSRPWISLLRGSELQLNPFGLTVDRE